MIKTTTTYPRTCCLCEASIDAKPEGGECPTCQFPYANIQWYKRSYKDA